MLYGNPLVETGKGPKPASTNTWTDRMELIALSCPMKIGVSRPRRMTLSEHPSIWKLGPNPTI